MGVTEYLILFIAGTIGGASNAIVGGGSLVTFPVLIALGVPPVIANASNTVALWPANAMAVSAYRKDLMAIRHRLPWRCAIAFAGGVVGAILLLLSGDALFSTLVPWLLGLATLLFAFSRPLVRLVKKWSGGYAHPAATLSGEFLFCIYGGYFGAGLGILLMAVMALGGEKDIQLSNAQKNLLAAFVNGSAAGFFALAGAVWWDVAIAQFFGCATGGYIGARIAKRIPDEALRAVVIVAGTIFTLIYFRNVYG